MNDKKMQMNSEKEEPTVTIRLPHLRGEDNDVFVSVNERTFLIRRGEEVKVPRSVAEVLSHAEEAKEESYHYDCSVGGH